MRIKMLGGNTKDEIERRLRVVATAGKLSRSEGTVTQVYDSNYDFDANLKLAKCVVGYGHKSISEHDYVVFALEDVTPIVEQTIIGYRLTSFTIKSRRNVDFRNVGFYIPDFHDKDGNVLSNNQELKDIYIKYMQSLFNKYGDLVDEELPIEDCRYILPYSYHSNIIMGCDANELLNMASDLLYGKVSNIIELHELGLTLKNMIDEYIPYLSKALDNEGKKDYNNDQFIFLDKAFEKTNVKQNVLLKQAKMTSYDKLADWKVCCNVIANRYNISYDDAEEVLHQISEENPEIKMEIINALKNSKHQRELEQVMYSFEMPISLAVLTHITRHRMHSLLVPDFVPMWNLENYISPSSVIKDHKEEYEEIFANNKIMCDSFKDQGVREEDLVYFYLSGNACNIRTTMNARNLEWISRMRCCNKAQWEIRKLVKECVKQAKDVNKCLGALYGPTCEVLGYCPEGKDSCKNRGVVVKKLTREDSK